MEAQYSIAAGQALNQSTLGFPAYGCIVENITNQWYYEPSRRRFIPPYQAGVTIPLVGANNATLECRSPGNIVQVGTIPGEYVTISYVDQLVPAGGGINVNTGLPVTVSAVDIVQGAQPGNPLAGLDRLWADVAGALHRLLPNGQDARLLDTANAIATANIVAHGITRAALAAGVSAGPTTTSAAPVAVPDLSVNINPGLTEDLLVIAIATLTHSVVGALMDLQLNLDGTTPLAPVGPTLPGASQRVTVVTAGVFLNVAAGGHSVLAQWWTPTAGTLSGIGTERYLVVVELER